MTVLLTTLGNSARAVEPGVDVAAPRVILVSATGSFTFQPGMITVEQGDYVRWMNTASFNHTSTSGPPCIASGFWNMTLTPGAKFTRQFLEAPGTIPYLCSLHCGSFGMTGTISLTSPILLQLADADGDLTLSWDGGGGTYRVLRSSVPNFTTFTVSQPAGGNSGTSFNDPTSVGVGSINYYLVMNL